MLFRSWPACRCARPPAILERRRGPGSSPRQRLDDRRRQIPRHRPRYPNPHLAVELHLDRRLAADHPGCRFSCCLRRRDQHRREAVGDSAEFLAPAIDLPSADIGATGNLADARPWRQALGTIARFSSSDQRRRRSPVITSTRAIAPSLALVQAPSFAPMLRNSAEPASQCKAALTEGLPLKGRDARRHRQLVTQANAYSEPPIDGYSPDDEVGRDGDLALAGSRPIREIDVVGLHLRPSRGRRATGAANDVSRSVGAAGEAVS